MVEVKLIIKILFIIISIIYSVYIYAQIFLSKIELQCTDKLFVIKLIDLDFKKTKISYHAENGKHIILNQHVISMNNFLEMQQVNVDAYSNLKITNNLNETVEYTINDSIYLYNRYNRMDLIVISDDGSGYEFKNIKKIEID